MIEKLSTSFNTMDRTNSETLRTSDTEAINELLARFGDLPWFVVNSYANRNGDSRRLFN